MTTSRKFLEVRNGIFPHMKCKINAFKSVPGRLKAGGTRRVCGCAGDRCLGVCGWVVSAD